MKVLVVYSSKTGFTAKYAKWIAEEVSADCMTVKEAADVDTGSYDAVLYGGGFYAGRINGADWMKKRIPSLKGKKAAVFATGALPEDSPEIKGAIDNNFSKEEQKTVTCFYYQAGINYEEMGWKSRIMMAGFRKMLKGKKDKTEQEKAMEQGISASFDVTDRRKLDGLFAWLG